MAIERKKNPSKIIHNPPLTQESQIEKQPIQFDPIRYRVPLLDMVTSEMELYYGWIEDTIRPSMDLYAAKGIVYDQLSDLEAHISKHGEKAVTIASRERLKKLISHLENLDKVISSNNTSILMVKHATIKCDQLELENKKLKEELNSVREAWKKMQ